MASSTKTDWTNYSGLGFGILFVSTASVLIRFAQNEVSSLVIAAYRLTIAGLILGIIILIKKVKLRVVNNRRTLLLSLLAGLFLAFHFAAWITSLEHTSVASSVVIVTTTPIWVALLSPLLLKESVSKRIVTGLLLAMIGMVVVSLSENVNFSQGQPVFEASKDLLSGEMLKGNLLALIGAFMAAGYMIVGRKVRKEIDSLPYTFVVYSFAAILIDITVLAMGSQIASFAPDTILILIGLAILPQLLGHSLFNWALAYLPASLVSIALLGEPIGTIILALIFLNEMPTIVEVIGASLILIGIIIASVSKKKANGV